MYLTREDLAGFLPDDVFTIRSAVYHRYSCGISDETAERIIADYREGLI